MKANSALSVALAAGCVSSVAMANNDLNRTAKGIPGAHVYIHVATGEVTVTPLSGPVLAGETADDVWKPSLEACGVVDNLSNLSLDDPLNSWGFGVFSGTVVGDWGDVPADSFVDCMVVNASMGDSPKDALDDPTPGDGIGVPVDGLARRLVLYERDNGFDTTIRAGLLALDIHDIYSADADIDGSGFTDDDATFVQVYFYTVDLDGSGFTFEMGDSDGVSDADLFYPNIFNSGVETTSGSMDLIGSDLDSDGLHDFAYWTYFLQPGGWDSTGDGIPDIFSDQDGDGNPDGVTADYRPCAVQSIFPEADQVWDTGAQAWINTNIAGPPAAQGVEDAFDIILPGYDPSMDAFSISSVFAGTYWFGGFACDGGPFPGPDGIPGTTDDVTTSFNIMAANHLHLLKNSDAPGPCGPADIAEPFGTLDAFDVFAFLGDYDLGACSGPNGDFNGDLACDAFDVFAFLESYDNGNGCAP